MKTKILFLGLVGLALAWLNSVAASENTNSMFVTYAETDDSWPVTQNQLDAMGGAKESLPASADPDGNWGDIVEGFQLSARFETNEIASNTPVKVTILLRNTTNQILAYSHFFGIGKDTPVCNFVVVSGGHTNVARIPPNAPFLLDGKSRWFELHSQTQKKFESYFDIRRFDTGQAKTITVFAKGRVPKAGGEGMATIESGTTTLSVVEGDNPTR